MKHLILILSFLGFILYSCQSFAYNVEDLDSRLAHAQQVIQSTYGDTVRIKPKTLQKFGRNTDIDTGSGFETVMTLPGTETEQTYSTTNDIDSISSSNAGDAQSVVIEGYYLVGSNLYFTVQTATLNGQTRVALSKPLYRATRIYNNGSTDFAGQVYVYVNGAITAGVPDDATTVRILTESGYNQSTKTATSLSHKDYWIVTGMASSVNRNASGAANVELQIREFGKVWRTIYQNSLNSTGTGAFEVTFDPVLIIPKNADMRVRADSSVNNMSISSRVEGYLALVQD